MTLRNGPEEALKITTTPEIQRLSAGARAAVLAAALTFGCALATWSGLGLVTYTSGVPCDWMASAFLVCALLFMKGRARMAAVGVSLAASVAIAHAVGWSWMAATLLTALTAGEAALAAALILRRTRTPRLFSLKQTALLVALAIAPAVLVSSVGAGLVFWLVHMQDPAKRALEWFAGHGVGMTMALPTLLILIAPHKVRPPTLRVPEKLALGAALLFFFTAPSTAWPGSPGCWRFPPFASSRSAWARRPRSPAFC